LQEKFWTVVEKKYRADYGAGNLVWGFFQGILFVMLSRRGIVWTDILYVAFGVVFILSTTIREYAVTELNFLEIRCVLRLFAKHRRIAIGDMTGLKKVKKNRLRIDKVRGFEELRVRETDMDALIAELKERNPRIRIAGEEEDF
jgi:hypothetical protein